MPARTPLHQGGSVGLCYYHWLTDAGWSSLAARRAHNPKVAGSNPAPATNQIKCTKQMKGLQHCKSFFVFGWRGTGLAPYNKKPAEAGLCLGQTAQACLRRAAPMPIKPKPSRAMLAGLRSEVGRLTH